MKLEKIKQSFNRAMDQIGMWDRSDISRGEIQRRYSSLINFIEHEIVPLTHADNAFQADVYKNLGYLKQQVGNFDDSVKYLDLALSGFTELDNCGGTAEVYILLGDTFRDYAVNNKAIESYHKAINCCEKLTDAQASLSSAHWGLGDLYRMNGSYEKALHHLDKAKTICEKQELLDELCNTLWTKAYVHIFLGDYDYAESVFKELVKRCDYGDFDESQRYSCLGALGDVYRLCSKHSQAISIYEEVERVLEIQEDYGARSWILTVMALSHMQLGQYTKAGQCLTKSGYCAKRCGDRISILWFYQTIGELERCLNEFDSAKEHIIKAQKMAKQFGMKNETAHSYLSMAELIKSKGGTASDYYEKALGIYDKIGAAWGIEQCLARINNPDSYLVPLNFS